MDMESFLWVTSALCSDEVIELSRDSLDVEWDNEPDIDESSDKSL